MRRKVKSEFFPLQLDLFLSDTFSASFSQILSPIKDVFQKKSEKELPPKIRFVECPDGKIEYELRRSKRRSIGFLINENGLRVTAPQKSSIKTIEEAIREKEHWIRNKLDYFLTQYKKLSFFPLSNGAILPYFGDNFSVRILKDVINHIELSPSTRELIIKTTDSNSQTLIKDLLTKWFHEKAKEYFSQRLPFFAHQLNVNYHQFTLTSARYRWGSCSISGNIRLNWRLIHFSKTLIDYVIVHELAHLHEMNHSKRFWNIVSQACPHYKTIRKELNQQGRALSSW